jgi:hypothetical protein
MLRDLNLDFELVLVLVLVTLLLNGYIWETHVALVSSATWHPIAFDISGRASNNREPSK